MTLFSAIIAAAKAFSALYERSVFSYLGINLRNRLNQEWASSTIHLRALNAGSFSISFFSSPLGRMWGTKPLAMTTSSLPTYAASRHKFCGSVSSEGKATRPFNKESRGTLSCRLAPVTTIDKGAPFSSTRRFRFDPFFSPVGRVRPDRLLREGCLDVRSVGSLPEPGDPLHFVIFGQPSPPKALKKTGCGPLPKFSVNRGRPKTFKFFSRQGIPDDASAQHVNDCRKVQSVRIPRLSPAAGLAFVGFLLNPRALGNQRLSQLPELIGNLPGMNTCHDLPPSSDKYLTDYPWFEAKMQDFIYR